MIKIEYDGSKGMFKLEERAKSEAERMANILGLVHEYYVAELKKRPEYAERFKKEFIDAINRDIIFVSNEEAHENFQKSEAKLLDEILSKLDSSLADLFKSLKETKTSKDKKKTKKD